MIFQTRILMALSFAAWIGANPAQAKVIKCSFGGNNGGLLYLSATDQVVNIQFIAQGPHIARRIDKLFTMGLGVVPAPMHAHSFEMNLPRNACQLATSVIGIECAMVELPDPSIPQPITETYPYELAMFSMPPVREAGLSLRKHINSLGKLDYSFAIDMKTDTKSAGAVEDLDCIE